MDNSDNGDNRTVVKPRSRGAADKSRASATPTSNADATVIKKSTESLDTAQARELTKIGKSLKTSDSNTGFEKARQAANQALVNNKIVLNNRFVLDSIISGGGMGTVYKARDLRKVEANDANPFVAVKVLNQDFKNHPDAFVTLQREASRSQVLAHPNIVLVHDFDRDGDVIYMTMQLLEGMDLEAYIKSQTGRGVALNEALPIIKDYCAALIYAHAKKIVHSDLKPGNIFITEQGAKVLDFGIARFSAGNQRKDSFDAGSLGALTPAYASLEMLNGEAPDQSDDVYAVAVIAYELISGKHPFQRKSAQEALRENLKPERLENLNKRQWQALESALQLKRSERTATVSDFLNQFTYTHKNLLLKTGAAALLVATGVLAYFEFFAPNELSGALTSTLKTGTQCFEAKDYACSKESASAVLQMEPGHSQAKKLYDASNLALQLAASRITAEKCFDEKRYNCVLDQTAAMLRLDPTNEFAATLASKASELQGQEELRNADIRKRYQESMSMAEQCFIKNDYECSMKYAKQALASKPGETDAETLYQKAFYAQGRQQEGLTRAKKVLEQGMICFKQKNYSCAIAKSESALEFVPGYKDALQLKQDAQHEVDKLKQSIQIR